MGIENQDNGEQFADPGNPTGDELDALLDGGFDDDSLEQEVDDDASSGVDGESNGDGDEPQANGDDKPTGDEPAGDADPNVGDAQDPVVLTKDGKNAIPFSVLQHHRDNAQRQTALADQREAELEQSKSENAARQAELQDQIDALKSNNGHEQDPNVDDALMSPDVEAALQEDAPEILTIFKGLTKEIERLKATTNAADERANQTEQDRAQQRQSNEQQAVADVIDNSPKLSFLQANDPKTFNKIAELDAALMGTSFGQEMSLGERINTALSQYESITGKEIQLPGVTKAGTGDPNAMQKVKEPSAPETLTDIPSGDLPAISKGEQLAGLSESALSSHFEGLSADAQNEFLAQMDLDE